MSPVELFLLIPCCYIVARLIVASLKGMNGKEGPWDYPHKEK